MKKLVVLFFLLSHSNIGYSLEEPSRDSIFLDFITGFEDTIHLKINEIILPSFWIESDAHFSNFINISKYLDKEKENIVRITYKKETLLVQINTMDDYHFYNIYFFRTSFKRLRVKKSKNPIPRY